MRPELRTDREGLATCLTLPPLVTAVRWAAVPLGVTTHEIPGPVDIELAAFLEVGEAPRRVLRRELGGGIEDAEPTRLSAALAETVLPEAALLAVIHPEDDPGSVLIAGTHVDPRTLVRPPFLPRAAIEIDGGLLVLMRRL
jgi:hypothetical protein